MEIFRIGLDEALSSLILLKVSLFVAEGLGLMTFKGAFQLKAVYELMS